MKKAPKKRTVQRRRRHPFTQLILEFTCDPDAWRECQKEYKKFLQGKSVRKAYQFLEPNQWRAIVSCDPKEINRWVEKEYKTMAKPKRRPTFIAAPRGGMPLLVGEWPTHQK